MMHFQFLRKVEIAFVTQYTLKQKAYQYYNTHEQPLYQFTLPGLDCQDAYL